MVYKICLIVLTIHLILIAECNAFPDSYKKLTRQEYIEHYARLAVEEMNEYGIPASITMAQACLESSDGNSTLARISNNHFGIKCKSGWTGQSVNHDDDERNECFRKYDSPIESFRDHSRFLIESDRYQFLFNYNITDYKRWAHGLKKAGYATDPNYPDRLIKIIEDYQLNELDRYYNSGMNYAGIKRRGLNSRRGSIGTQYPMRSVYERNRSRAFYAKTDDTYEQIAREFDLKEWEIFKYNDCVKGSRPEENSIVYIRGKRGKAPRGNEYHIFRGGESMWSIAQWYGIRLNALYRINKMKKSDEPLPGQRISLRKKVKK
jgi:hypothetical protein